MNTLSDKICQALISFSPVVHVANSGSIYISFTGSKVREIRIGNHSGHKLKRNAWEVRSDAMTSRGKFNRVYNVNSVNQMIKDFK